MMHGGIVKVIKPVGLSNSTGFCSTLLYDYIYEVICILIKW